MDDTLAEALGQLIKLFDRGNVLREAKLAELRIVTAQIVTVENRVRPHASGEKAATKRAIAQRGNAVLGAIRQQISFDAALEQIVRRLQHVQVCGAAEPFHLCNREIA